MNWTILGNNSFAISVADGLLESGQHIVRWVALPKDDRPNNPADIEAYCAKHGILLSTDSIESQVKPISATSDYVFASWPKILTAKTLSQLPSVVGSHPGDLPKGRGRHVMHWMVALGIEKGVLSLYRMDAGVDSGPVYLKEPFQLPKECDIDAANSVLDEAGNRAITRLCEWANDVGLPSPVPQKGTPTYWHKRTPEDCVIDFRMRGDDIVRLVRSFCPPNYPGCTVKLHGEFYHVKQARMEDGGKEIIQLGTVVEHNANIVSIAVMGGIVRLMLDRDYCAKKVAA